MSCSDGWPRRWRRKSGGTLACQRVFAQLCGRQVTALRLRRRCLQEHLLRRSAGLHKRTGRHGCVAMHRERAVVTDIAAGVGEILAFHLGADSLDVVEVVMSFEERFNIYIPNDVATKFVTVGDAVDFIEVQVAQAAGSGLVYHPPRPRLAVG